MCGIAGLFTSTLGRHFNLVEAAECMIRELKHRGPDDEGVWHESFSGVSLAHRRLSILDLSETGHQPMLSHCGRYVIIFNGEIYNHHAIRQELFNEEQELSVKGWRGNSDTETLISAIAQWGLEKALDKAVGMFAFALWDRTEKVLYLARDRIGEKPLYYGLHKGTFIFASELKALRAYPGFQSEVDRDALVLFLIHNVIPAPLTIYRGIFKMPPGTLLKVTQENVSNGTLAEPIPYWSMLEAAIIGQGNLFNGTAVEACNELERLMKQSISGQMLADVPVGAFLSGGIDSSTVVAMMQAESTRPVRTFTIGFHECGYDEAQHARAVASHLGTEHTELYVTSEQALAVIPRLAKLYDEPFADISQIPTFLVSELARDSVTVCLSGDGGDELFGGYNRYTVGARFWNSVRWLPKSVRIGLAEGISAISASAMDSLFDRFGSKLPRELRVGSPGVKLQKITDLLRASSSEEVYQRLVSHWSHAEHCVIGAKIFAGTSQHYLNDLLLPEMEHRMMYADSISYLPDDVLVKLDRAAMGVSLETRVPMLDHRVVEFSWRLPLKMKIHNHEGKWLLRQVLDRYLPRSLVDRPKAGFGVPLDIWLRGPLREWAEELLNPELLKNQGYFLPGPIRRKWKEHLDEKRNWSSHLWSILMFQEWIKSGE